MKKKKLVAKTLKIILLAPIASVIIFYYFYWMALPFLVVAGIIPIDTPARLIINGINLAWSVVVWGLTLWALYCKVDDWEKE